MRTAFAATLLLASAVVPGCIPAMIATGVYAASVRDEDRAAMHAHNLERERAGLKPLTWEEWSRRKPDDGSKPGDVPAEEPGT